MIFALCGSHRTGKTTLAQEFARVSGAKFIPMSITRLQRKLALIQLIRAIALMSE